MAVLDACVAALRSASEEAGQFGGERHSIDFCVSSHSSSMQMSPSLCTAARLDQINIQLFMYNYLYIYLYIYIYMYACRKASLRTTLKILV